jgi:hypothetical protein
LAKLKLPYLEKNLSPIPLLLYLSKCIAGSEKGKGEKNRSNVVHRLPFDKINSSLKFDSARTTFPRVLIKINL